MTDNAIPRASIVETPLVGEPATDKAYQCADDGAHYRVRVLPVAGADPSSVAVYQRAYEITITRLDADMAVERNHDASIDIVAATRMTVDQDSWLTSTPAETLQRLIEQLIYRAMTVSRAKKLTDQMMADWGVEAHVSAAKDSGVAIAASKI